MAATDRARALPTPQPMHAPVIFEPSGPRPAMRPCSRKGYAYTSCVSMVEFKFTATSRLTTTTLGPESITHSIAVLRNPMIADSGVAVCLSRWASAQLGEWAGQSFTSPTGCVPQFIWPPASLGLWRRSDHFLELHKQRIVGCRHPQNNPASVRNAADAANLIRHTAPPAQPSLISCQN
jgi:hypothetical protein